MRRAAGMALLIGLLLCCSCVTQEAVLYEAAPTDTLLLLTPGDSPFPTETAQPEQTLLIPAVTGSAAPCDANGIPIFDADTHYFTYYLVFSDLRVYEYEEDSFLDGVCTNHYGKALVGAARVVFRDEAGRVFGYGQLHTAEGDCVLQAGENRIYAEILTEVDVKLMDLTIEIDTPFLPVTEE